MHPNDFHPDVLPWSPEAESAVLGSLLSDNGNWDRVGDLLQARQFYESANGVIFTVIGSLVTAGKPADLFTVFDELQRAGDADRVGGLPYLTSLAGQVVGAANARRYAEIVAERALMRGLIEAAAVVKDLAVKPGLRVAERIDQAQQALQSLQVNGGRLMPTTAEDSVVRLIDRIQRTADGDEPPVISTGIPGLDRMLGGGLRGGKQIILAARPSVGKSSLAQQLCLNLARAGHGAAIFSQEMTKDDLTDRAMCNLGDIPLDRIITGRLEESDWTRFAEGVERFRGLPLYLDDQPALTLHDIAAKARMLKRKHDVKLIALDYLQLCGGMKDGDSRHHQIEHLSRGLKTLAKQLDLTFLTLSQLNREVEKRASGRPVLSDLKESGAIEEDADVVVLLSRHSDSPHGFQIINADLPKNRQGRVGTLALGFDGSHQRWHETAIPSGEFKSTPRKHYTEDL